MKVCILTLGCKVNTYESEFIKGEFLHNNYSVVDLLNKPDVIVINTCTVTNQSDAKSRKLIRQARRENPNSILVVCGCSSENHRETLLSLGIDILLGNKDKSKIIEYVQDFITNQKPISKFYDLKNCSFEDMQISNFSLKTRGFVKIQDGCNNYCSYCIIPYIRGTIRNKDLNTAYEEIKQLVDNDFKEIVLTGIHTGSYGTGTDYNLITLIRKISTLDNLKRIRISSIETTEIDDEFLEELKNNPKICNHLHIPIQSGSNQVLKDMNRKYDISKYFEIIAKIRSIRPNINITTDLIVGFPTETKEYFEETIHNIYKIGFGKIHVFPYSKRDGTVASNIKSVVTDQEKKKRTQKMLEISDELENNYYNKQINQKEIVLIEDTTENTSCGYTSNYLKVHLDKKIAPNVEYLSTITSVDGVNVKGR